MGSYGIGIERILTATIEQNNDENGFWLPPQIAPFEIVVTPTNVRTRRSEGPPKISPNAWKRPGLTCYWMTGTNGQGSSSRTLIWWAYPFVSTWGRRLPKVLWKSLIARHGKCRMLASAQ